MPGNELEEKIRILYELDNFSLGQHHSQAIDDSQPVLIYDQWLEKQRQSFNLKSSTVQQFDSLRGHGSEPFTAFDQNYGQLTQRPDLSSNQSINQELNPYGFMLEWQNFQTRQFLGERTGFDPHNLTSRGLSVLKSQQEYASVDSPTLTTNSERSEMTDASTEYNFVGGKQLVSGQQPGIPQSTPMQQPGFNDVQLLQQHIMLKKLQELQRQQQLQQFGDARQQNSLHHQSSITKQVSGVQYPTLINGTPVNDASQMFMSWVQRGAAPAAQGISNRVVFSQEQGQTLHSMPLVPQQFDVSLYGTPVASARGTMSHYSHIQGMSHDSSNLLNKVSGQTQKPVVQSTAVSNPFIGDQCTFSPDQVGLSQGTLISKNEFQGQGKNMFGQIPVQGLHSGATLGNSLLESSLQANASLHELSGKQDLGGWPGILQQKTMQHGSSHDLVSLDPMEEKILYNTDDDVWNDSFSRRSDMVAGGFGNTADQIENSDVFPSIQSGSWSALMQSAVGEASSSDTGLQEEWSGLTFQNTELSTDNQTSNIMDSEKQQRGWADNNLQNDSSLSSKPLLMLNDSSVSSSFPGFNPTDIQFMTKQREDLQQDESHESIQKSPKDMSEWLDYNPQPTLPMEGSEQIQRLVHLDNPWAGQINKLSENNAHQQRIVSYDIESKSSTKPEGHTNEAMYNRRDSDGFPWKAGGDGELTSLSRLTGGLLQVQANIDNSLLSKENSHLLNRSIVPASHMTKPHQETSQHVSDSNLLDYTKQNSYVAVETYGQQQNCYPRGNSYDNYNPEGLKRHKQGHLGQFKFMGDVSNNSIGLDKGHLPNLRGNSRALEESSRGDLDISATFHRSIGSGGQNINAQPSQDMLELLPKADQSKENAAVSHFGSTGFGPSYELAEAGSAQGSIAQMYYQASGSQGFALRLAPPSQRVANPNTLYSQGSPLIASNLNLRQAHSDLGGKNQTQLVSPSSFQSSPASNELSPRDRWDDKFNISERPELSSSLYIHQSSVAAIPSNPPITRNQLQMRLMSNGPVSYPSQATMHGTATRHIPFNLASSQDTSQHIRTKPSGSQFPGLEAATISQPPVISNIPQPGGFSVRPQSSLTNSQHLLVMEPYKIPSVDPLSNRVEATSLTQLELNDQDSQKAGCDPLELGTSSINSQGSVLDEDQSRKEGSQMLLSSRMLNALQAGVSNISDKNALASGSLLAHSHQQDLDRLHRSHNHSPTTSERSHESFGHASKPSHGLRQNFSLLHQMQAMKNVETDQSRKVLDAQQLTAISGQQSAFDHNSTYGGLNSASQLNSLSGDTKMPNLLTEAREDPRVKVLSQLSQPALQDIPSQGMVAFRQNNFHSQPSGSNVVSDLAENSLANLNVVPSWFKQCGTLRNGQIPPIYEAKLAGTPGVQFSLLKLSQTSDIHSSVEQLNVADASQSGRVWPSTAAAVAASEPFSASYMRSLDVIDQNVATARPKKRKTMASEHLPWHEEVSQGSKRFQDMSIAEQHWAQASNRLIEKVEDEVEIIEDGRPLLRTKRRLILTTQLMQQLLCPAPAPVFIANAAFHYESVICFVARFSLGDACSLIYDKRNDLCEQINGNMIAEELKNSECIDGQHFSKAVEDFTSRSKKLESDLLRLDKATSILDLRMECQELEKVSVINRFAKFHVRPAGVSGTTSASGTTTTKLCPQRYIIALPMPENVPEGVQCLSL
ncbi:hypothetical protein TorRG33x02_207560 [Trema orientale]|uniref:Dentin sialophosphoprotein-like protein n=1 Tax=Trema orientale TaxID=63057 RepID=A0A2P5ED80_TREOI|nr:hypothetical protein TorRG33x02_207560 [Trema orientale]